MRPKQTRNLALVGKGITFDSGGLSLKSADWMVKMRGDMGGAAAVLAAFEVIAESRLGINVMAIIAAAENLPGRGAQRPGDVWTSAAGKTVEVLNTDAEGRLVLADAMTYAIRSGATHLVDLATLTSDARAALGHAASAAVSNDDHLWELVAAAGQAAGDRVWRLPIYPDFRPLIQSQSADLKNADYGEAGVITAAMFIGEFVEGRPWVHLDIAGSHWNENQQHKDIPRGPLGAGTRLCYRLAELMAAQSNGAIPMPPDKKRVPVLISTWLDPTHAERIAAAEPERIELIYEPELLPTTRYEADHHGPPRPLTDEQRLRWRNGLARAEVSFEFDWERPEELLERAPRLRWVQSTSSGIGPLVEHLGLAGSRLVITNAAGIHAQPLAEFVLLTALYFAKEMPRVNTWKKSVTGSASAVKRSSGRT